MSLGPDPHSYANFEDVLVTRLDLAFGIDFDRQLVRGRADVEATRRRPDATVLRLDVKGLVIGKATDAETGEALAFQVLPSTTALGDCMEVALPAAAAAAAGAAPCRVRIEYETSPGSAALCWLEPGQTLGRRHPLVFTQCQAICGRSLFPCQDTPAVKMPFSLEIEVPKPLVAVASGIKKAESSDDGRGTSTFVYEQKVPVMSYLVAVLAGNIERRRIGPRSHAWAEPELVEVAQRELDGVCEEFIRTAGEIVGSPYEWGHYDVAVLPSSFAYGGMENPNVTFFSASLLAGDASLTTTLAHEVAHSWSGNLVTNARWKDFWLNEGFTRYIERRILGRLHGPAFRGLLLMVGYNDLVKTVDMLTSQGDAGLTRLEPEIVGISPDLAFSRVPYEKGSLFLHFLEGVVGGEDAMSAWLEAWIGDNSGKSVQVQDFQRHFAKFFEARKVDLSPVDWELWLHGEGVPKYDLASKVDSSLLVASQGLADGWLAGGRALMHRPRPEGVAEADLQDWRAQQIMLFLDNLINAGPDAVPEDRLQEMDRLYGLSKTRNVEVAFRWGLLAMKSGARSFLPVVDAFLGTHGRGAYVKPLYSALDLVDHDFAVAAFEKHGGFYMAVIRAQVKKLLGV